MENSERDDPRAAQAALASVDTVRAALADRAHAPWWYHVGLGLSAGLVFASIDAGGSLVPSGVIAGGIVLPVALTLSVARTRGISFNRSLPVADARPLNGLYMIVLLVLCTVGLILKLGVELPGGMSAAGLVALALTVYVSRRNDDALRRDLASRSWS